MTTETQDQIDDMSYVELLEKWRFSPSDSPWFTGGNAVYSANRLNTLKSEMDISDVVRISKKVGW